MGRSPHLLLCAFKTANLAPELQVSICPRPHLCICACKTAYLPPAILVSIGPSPHLWFLNAKQRLSDQNYKSLWVPALICGFCIRKSDFTTRIRSLYGTQPSSVVLCIRNKEFKNRITSLYVSLTSPVELWIQNSMLCTRMTSLYVFQP